MAIKADEVQEQTSERFYNIQVQFHKLMILHVGDQCQVQQHLLQHHSDSHSGGMFSPAQPK